MRARPVFGLLIPSLLVSASAAVADAPLPPPNVVFILADDLGWRDLSCYGSTFYETPNVDRLAARGDAFRQSTAPPRRVSAQHRE